MTTRPVRADELAAALRARAYLVNPGVSAADERFAVNLDDVLDLLSQPPDTGDHALHYDPDCEECVYLARPVAVHVPQPPDTGEGLREAAQAFVARVGSGRVITRPDIEQAAQRFAVALGLTEAMSLNEYGRAECICGESVLPDNWPNHLLRKSGRPHAALRASEVRPDDE